MQQLARRERVGQISPIDFIAAGERNDRFIVEGARRINEVSIRGQLSEEGRLGKRIVRVIVVGAENGLVGAAEYILGIGELQAKALGALEQARLGVLGQR